MPFSLQFAAMQIAQQMGNIGSTIPQNSQLSHAGEQSHLDGSHFGSWK